MSAILNRKCVRVRPVVHPQEVKSTRFLMLGIAVHPTAKFGFLVHLRTIFVIWWYHGLYPMDFSHTFIWLYMNLLARSVVSHTVTVQHV